MALRGIKVLELAGLAPAPFCGSILADFGATVTRVDKHIPALDMDCLSHGKRSVALNLKHPEGALLFRQLSNKSDVIIEPFRKGVMEKLGLGPEVLMKDNPKLIYARLTGFGQAGVLADRAGHDINYIALSGLLSMLGRAEQPPTAPINLLADFAGGGLTCALGIVLALLERTRSTLGQVVDCSMVEGAAYIGSWIFRSQRLPIWGQPKGYNMLDSGSHFYDTYITKDGGYLSVGAIEPQFYSLLLKGLGLTEEEAPQYPENSEELRRVRETLATKFLSKSRDEWMAIFGNSDACVAPVLSLQEVTTHPHNVQRNSFTKDIEGYPSPNPAPQLSRTPGSSTATQPRPMVGEHTVEALKGLNYEDKDIERLVKEGIVGIQTIKSKM